MTDSLDVEEMMAIQRDFQENFFDPDNMTMQERHDWLESFVMHAMDQSTSLLNELNWKEHEPKEPVDYDQVLRELVDIWKYVINLAVVLNVDPVEFSEEFYDRTEEVETRYERQMR